MARAREARAGAPEKARVEGRRDAGSGAAPAEARAKGRDGGGPGSWRLRLRDAYDHGPSRLYRSNDASFTGKPATLDQYSLYDSSKNQYYSFKTKSWRAVPYGDAPTDLGDAVQMTWPEVWATMSIDWFADKIIAPLYGNTQRDKWRADSVASSCLRRVS